MNGAVQLLVAEPFDNLPLPPNATTLQRAYSSNDTLRTSLHVSNYGGATFGVADVKVSWAVVVSRAGAANVTVCEHSDWLGVAVEQGPGTTLVAEIACKLPDLGTLADTPTESAATITLSARIGQHANKWRARLYPLAREARSIGGRTIYTLPQWCSFIPDVAVQCAIPPLSDATKLPPGSVFVVDYLSSTLLQFAAMGHTVFLNGNGTAPVSERCQAPLPVGIRTVYVWRIFQGGRGAFMNVAIPLCKGTHGIIYMSGVSYREGCLETLTIELLGGGAAY